MKATVIPRVPNTRLSAFLSAVVVLGVLAAPAHAHGAVPERGDVYVPNGSTTLTGATIINDGHIDIASLLHDGALTTRVKDTSVGSDAVWREPGQTVLQLLPESQTAVPADPAFAFLGAPGSPLWQVTQTQQDGLLWPGWSTEALPSSATRGGVAWTLGAVEGYPDDTGTPSPVGGFSIYSSGIFGAPSVLLDSADPTRSSFVIPRNVHAHGAWSFTAEGVYCLSFGRTAEAPDGTVLHDDFVLAMAVGNVAVRAIDPGRCFERPVPTLPVDPALPVDPTLPVDPALPDGPTPPAVPAVPGPPAVQPVLPGDDGAVTDPVTVPGAPQPGDPLASAPGPGTPPVPSAAPVPAPASMTVPATRCVAGATILSSGHVDYASRIVDGKLESLVKDGTSQSPVWREPASTVIWLKPAAKVTLPSSYSAIGPVGASVWQVPQTQNAELVWLGWNTEELPATQAVSPVSWTLNSVAGPGSVKVFLQGSFGEIQSVVFDNGGTHSIALGKHVHGNWAFSAEGVYRLGFTQSVTLPGGGTSTDTETLTVAVGAVDPTRAIAGGGAGCGAVALDAGASRDSVAVDAAAQAAAQAAAAAAAPSENPQRERPSAPSSRATDDRTSGPVAAASTPTTVRVLLFVLGGLLVAASGAGAAWWLRNRPGAGRAAAGE